MIRQTPLVRRVEDRYHQPIAKILRDRYPGMGGQQIADELGVNCNTVYYWLRKSGIHLQLVLVGHGERVEIRKN